MSNSNKNFQKFQKLLLELFQFDSADLDFGIYRILNYKRDVVEKYINEDLPKALEPSFKSKMLASVADE